MLRHYEDQVLTPFQVIGVPLTPAIITLVEYAFDLLSALNRNPLGPIDELKLEGQARPALQVTRKTRKHFKKNNKGRRGRCCVWWFWWFVFINSTFIFLVEICPVKPPYSYIHITRQCYLAGLVACIFNPPIAGWMLKKIHNMRIAGSMSIK